MAGALRVSLNLESPTPAYRQIANDLRRHLVEERLKPGDLLPPIRQLALDLGVHFNTVALAYRLLAEEGWLETPSPASDSRPAWSQQRVTGMERPGPTCGRRFGQPSGAAPWFVNALLRSCPCGRARE
jgi:DNA-binding transcriptional MocR family regulator